LINKTENSIIVCVPYLNNIGGTEIEAILSALHFYDTYQYKKVAIFSPSKCNIALFHDLIENRAISFLHYPVFFGSKWAQFLNRIFKKLGLTTPLFELIYWFFVSLRYTHFFILTYPGCMYFFPLFNFYKQHKKYVAKITMWHYIPLSVAHQLLYEKFNTIVVFNAVQQAFWKQKNVLSNLKNLDIMILNEKNLLSVPELTETSFANDTLCFGYLGRISREKNIEDMIYLLDFLNHKNQKKCQLLIQGAGDAGYLKELEALVLKLHLNDFITFRIGFVSPNQTHDFYSKIAVLLVTSIHEGGPMTSLEAAASGRYVMGYDIGAMQDRFGSFPYVINSNLDSLCDSALAFLNLTTFEKLAITNEFRQFYISKLSNASKGQQLNHLFE
jgi:glycosyltransferase involved in cell wall biosynthesis